MHKTKFCLLLVSTLLLNFTSKIVYCALLFTCITLILNHIAKAHGSRQAAISIVLSTATSLALLYKQQYYIAGKLISGLIVASLSSMLVASYIGFKLFLKLQSRYSFAISHFIASLASALVDGFAMALFFSNKYAIQKVLSIFCKEIYYKSIFSFVVYLCLVVVFYAKHVYRKIGNNDFLVYLRKRPYQEL